MAEIRICDFPEELYRKIRDRAARNHRSLDAEVIALIEEGLERDALWERRSQALERIARRRASSPKSSNSLELLREDRDR